MQSSYTMCSYILRVQERLYLLGIALHFSSTIFVCSPPLEQEKRLHFCLSLASMSVHDHDTAVSCLRTLNQYDLKMTVNALIAVKFI